MHAEFFIGVFAGAVLTMGLLALVFLIGAAKLDEIEIDDPGDE